jgi:hypothetical protein
MSTAFSPSPRNEVSLGVAGPLAAPPPPKPSPSAIASVVPEKETNLQKAKRFYADTEPVLRIMMILAALICTASFVVSYAGLFAAGEWAVGAVPILQGVIPFMLDAAIITFTIALFIEREREESVVGTWIAVAVFAAISCYANVLHTLAVGTGVTIQQIVLGCILSGGAPIMLAFVTDKVAVKLFKPLREPLPVLA